MKSATRIAPSLLLPALVCLSGVSPSRAHKVLGDDLPTSCTKCFGNLLPGRAVEVDSPKFSVHSDLPEIFHTPGVLYSTRPVLPPFQIHVAGGRPGSR